MKNFLVLALCLGYVISSVTIPLKSKVISATFNEITKNIDTILYAEGSFTNLGSNTKLQDENILFDLLSDSNYVISRNTKCDNEQVSSSAFEFHNTQLGSAVKSNQKILGGKSSISGGVLLNEKSSVKLDGLEVESNIYIPDQVDLSTLHTNIPILQFANAGLGFSNSKNGLISQLAATNKSIKKKQFSVYIHDSISQISIGESESYLTDPNHQKGELPTVGNSWTVTINDIKTRNGSKMNNRKSVNANFDLTSRYSYVPRSEHTTSDLFFMNSKELPCFQINQNLENKISYTCEPSKFSYDDYSPITFVFNGEDKQAFEATLNPKDYIQKNAEGFYELLFRLTSIPQNPDEFYLGTSFMSVFYPTFNIPEQKITLQKKYNIEVPVNGPQIANEYRLPVIIIGSLITLLSVGAILAVLQKVKVPEAPFKEVPTYLRNSQATNPLIGSQVKQAPHSPKQSTHPATNHQGSPSSNYNLIQQNPIYGSTTNLIPIQNPQALVSNNPYRQIQAQPRQIIQTIQSPNYKQY